MLTGLNNDIYLQVSLITTIGVSAKNAILIVEFADERVQAGMNAFDAAMAAARLRLRPILMTSLAFVFGVLPPAVSNGAGAGWQNPLRPAVGGGRPWAADIANLDRNTVVWGTLEAVRESHEGRRTLTTK